jgi:hypothetical protein
VCCSEEETAFDLKDYGKKPPVQDLKSQCHCERSEAICARKQRLLRHLQLLAMTVPPSGVVSVARILSHGPKITATSTLCTAVLSPMSACDLGPVCYVIANEVKQSFSPCTSRAWERDRELVDNTVQLPISTPFV